MFESKKQTNKINIKMIYNKNVYEVNPQCLIDEKAWENKFCLHEESYGT